MSDVTRLLEAAKRGEREAEEKLLNLVYTEHHRMLAKLHWRVLQGIEPQTVRSRIAAGLG